MAKHKQYEIDTFERLCNVVNNENSERLAIDLAQWLIAYNKVISDYREKFPKETEGKKNTEIAIGSFTWVDDGKNDFKGFDLTNGDTGEITKVRF